MRRIQIIRSRLGLSQTELAEAVGRTQPQISAYERGATIQPDVATRLIEAARARGLAITYDHVYGDADVPYVHRSQEKIGA